MSFSGWVVLVLKYWKTSLMPVKTVKKETGSLVAIQEQSFVLIKKTQTQPESILTIQTT